MSVPSPEDDWERDINLGPSSTDIFSANLSSHNGLSVNGGVRLDPINDIGYGYCPDKELAIACERYHLNAQLQQQMPFSYYHEDDCNTSIAGSSVFTSTASKFTEPSLLYSPVLDDDFMFDEPMLPSKRYSLHLEKSQQPALAVKVINDQRTSAYPGIVQQLGTPAKHQEPKDSDDWTDDISIFPRQDQQEQLRLPSFGPDHQSSPTLEADILTFDLSRLTQKLYEIPKIFEMEHDDDGLGDFDEDDIGPSVSQRCSVINMNIKKDAPAAPMDFKVPGLPNMGFEIEDDEDDNNMEGLDFPLNMSTLASKIEEKKKYDPSKASPAPELPFPSYPQTATARFPRPTATRIPVATANRTKVLASFSIENDDDDFFSDLALNDTAFDFNHQQQQQQQHMDRHHRAQLSNSKSNTRFVSKLARPTPVADRLPLSSQPQPQTKPQQKQRMHKLSTVAPITSSSASRLEGKRNLVSYTQPSLQNKPTAVAQQKRSIALAAALTSSRQQSSASWQSSSRLTTRPTFSPSIKNTNSINTARPSRLLTNPSFLNQQQPQQRTSLMRRSPTARHTLIAQPKSKPGSGAYRTEIDDLDNLPTVAPKKKITAVWKTMASTKQQRTADTSNPTSDPKRPWRTNMQTGKSKVKLLQPNQQDLKKEYNNMKYDERTHTWKGNEDSLSNFVGLESNNNNNSNGSRKQQKKPVSGLRLISMPRIANSKRTVNNTITKGNATAATATTIPASTVSTQPKTASRYTAVMSHNMIFDDRLQKWVSALGEENECNELDAIKDLYVNSNVCMTGIRNGRNPAIHGNDKTLEFKMSTYQKRQMMFEQEDHENFMKHWPLENEDRDKVMTPSGHLVPASKYFWFYLGRNIF